MKPNEESGKDGECEEVVDLAESYVGDDIDAIRVRRLLEMKKQHSVQNTLRGLGHGAYTEVVESEFLDSVIKSRYVVVHFYHDEFARCKAVDKHLSLVALSLIGIRFVKLNSQKCPFFVNKLQVKVLPTILYFVNGKTVHRLVGFEELGGNQDFKVSALVASLKEHRMLRDCVESEYKDFLPLPRKGEEDNEQSDSE